jgi:uncharacterized protein YxjI
MNFEKGAIIAKVLNSKLKGDVLHVTDKTEELKDHFNTYNCKDKESIQQIPDKQKERQILYITGASGSGKSYYTYLYCEQYRKMYPKNPIYLISSINDDSSIDKIKGLKRFILDDKFMNTPIGVEDFKNSMVIFDDTDCITNKILRNKINGILGLILETGRHFNTSCIYTSHVPSAGLDTKKILNESHSITLFPNALGGRALKNLLENYLGFDKEQRKKIRQIKSRWITITKTYPMTVLYEKGAYLVNNNEEDV